MESKVCIFLNSQPGIDLLQYKRPNEKKPAFHTITLAGTRKI